MDDSFLRLFCELDSAVRRLEKSTPRYIEAETEDLIFDGTGVKEKSSAFYLTAELDLLLDPTEAIIDDEALETLKNWSEQLIKLADAIKEEVGRVEAEVDELIAKLREVCPTD